MTAIGATAFDNLPLAQALRELAWLHLSVQVAHTFGFVVLVGAILVFDLRLLGFSKQIPVRVLSRHTLPWCLAAFLLILPSGLLLFTAHAQDFLASRAFQVKMGLILAAGMNAAWFRTGPYQGVAAWDRDVATPLAARASAALSIAIWLGVLTCGRFVATVTRS